MMCTTVPLMINTEPFHFEAEFDKPYDEITANDVLEKAATFLELFSESFIQHGGRARLPTPLRESLYLRYISKDAFPLTSNLLPGSPIEEIFPSPYTHLAADWYQNVGYHLSSTPVDGASRLVSTALLDATMVRWYILLSVPVKALPVTISIEIASISDERQKYIRQVKDDVNNRKTTKVASPCKLGKDPKLWTAEQRRRTHMATGQCPPFDYGLHPGFMVPIFAKAYNSVWKPETVELERATSPDQFDIVLWLDELEATCLAEYDTEFDFNIHVFAQLKKLFPFLDMELHVKIKDENNIQATEMDMLGTCNTPHGNKGAPIIVEGKTVVGSGGDPILQVFNADQRMLALDPAFTGTLRWTSCPTVLMAVTGYVVRVYLMYFGDKIYGAHLFSSDLSRSAFKASSNELDDLASKFQILRNTVRDLCDFYKNTHAGTELPAVPYLFPQPVSLLKSLPSHDPELLCRLSSLKLVITHFLHSSRDPGRCLFKGVSYASGTGTPVYVKFVMSQYGEAAHRLLASQQPPLAPQLIWCGEIVYRKTMIVMEALPKPPALDAQDAHPCKHNKEHIDIIKRDIRLALDVLHRHGLVHGDVRQPNIVIVKKRGYLIDFDMAGEAGLARYPGSLNPDVWWPGEKGKKGKDLHRMPILIAHDNLRLDRTLGELNGLFDHEDKDSLSSKRKMGEDGDGEDERTMKRLRETVTMNIEETFGNIVVE